MPEILKEYRIKFQKVPKCKKALADPTKLGIRSKLGGEPDWCQRPDVPKCKSCKEKMTFVAQIDSIEHDEGHNPHRIDCLSDEQQYMFGDVGMLYLFVCLDCMETRSVLQCG